MTDTLYRLGRYRQTFIKGGKDADRYRTLIEVDDFDGRCKWTSPESIANGHAYEICTMGQWKQWAATATFLGEVIRGR